MRSRGRQEPTPWQQQHLQEVFVRCDNDKDGRITVEELRTALYFLGKNLKRREVTDILEENDLHENGMIDEDEFMCMIEDMMAKGELVLVGEAEVKFLKEAFERCDRYVSHDGHLHPDEIGHLLQIAGFAEEEIESQVGEMLEEGDLDGSGSLDLQEFLALMAHKKNVACLVVHGQSTCLTRTRRCRDYIFNPIGKCVSWIARKCCCRCSDSLESSTDLPDVSKLGNREDALHALGVCARLVGGTGNIDSETWGKFDPPLDGAGWTVVEQVCETKGSKWAIQAACYFNLQRPDVAIVAFRGTSTLRGLWQDASILTPHKGSPIRRACNEARIFVDYCKEKYSERIFFVTGLSLGGYLAEVVASKMDIDGAAFNNPGPWALSNSSAGLHRPNFEIHLTRDDPMSLIFPHPQRCCHIGEPRWHNGDIHRICYPYVPDEDDIVDRKPNTLHFDKENQVDQLALLEGTYGSDDDDNDDDDKSQRS